MCLVFLCAVLLFSCEKPADPPEATVILADHDDAEIARIAEDARSTLYVFFRYLNRTGSGKNNCYVKYPFTVDDNSGVNREQIWLTGIQFKNGRYFGILAGVPLHLGGKKKGDMVIFDMDAITDWMYIQSGKIIGGESIKYLLEKIPEDQRSDRERELLRMLF